MIRIIGIGPGHKSYILPEAMKHIKLAHRVIGARRHLDTLEGMCKDTIDYEKGFSYISQYLREHRHEDIAVVVSGDASFYSMLRFVKGTVHEKDIEVVPGISSLQYIYAKLKKGYEEAKWISYHGREVDVIQALKQYPSVGILTDYNHSPAYIAKELYAHGIEEVSFYVGERLSYEDERIRKMTVQEAMSYEVNALSVVVIEHE